MNIYPCATCKKMFRSDGQSPWCISCKEGMEWDDQQNQLKNEKPISEKKIKDSGVPIQSGEQRNLKDSDSINLKMQTKNESVQEIITKKTEPQKLKTESTGLERIEINKMLTTENTMQEIGRDSSNQSLLPDIVGNQPLQLMSNSVSLEQEISHSINSLNESGKELFSLMKGLRADVPDSAVRLFDTDRVQTAVMCANQIVNTAKAKLELMKFAREIK